MESICCWYEYVYCVNWNFKNFHVTWDTYFNSDTDWRFDKIEFKSIGKNVQQGDRATHIVSYYAGPSLTCDSITLLKIFPNWFDLDFVGPTLLVSYYAGPSLTCDTRFALQISDCFVPDCGHNMIWRRYATQYQVQERQDQISRDIVSNIFILWMWMCSKNIAILQIG